mmetsp:Transcript_124617/g.357934  ORF Transcript_124617/g.357934 Transcript_124617/m.357934 type:complete len:229 (+) Transcript_124617:55-741(+)
MPRDVTVRPLPHDWPRSARFAGLTKPPEAFNAARRSLGFFPLPATSGRPARFRSAPSSSNLAASATMSASRNMPGSAPSFAAVRVRFAAEDGAASFFASSAGLRFAGVDFGVGVSAAFSPFLARFAGVFALSFSAFAFSSASAAFARSSCNFSAASISLNSAVACHSFCFWKNSAFSFVACSSNGFRSSSPAAFHISFTFASTCFAPASWPASFNCSSAFARTAASCW